MIILTRVGWHHIVPTWSKQEERTYTTPPRNTKSIPKVMFHQKNRYRFVWIVFVFFHFLFLFQQKYNNNIIFYINKYIYIYIWWCVPCSHPSPPGSNPFPSIWKLLAAFLRSSLIFARSLQHFWLPATHTHTETDRQTDRQTGRQRYTDT